MEERSFARAKVLGLAVLLASWAGSIRADETTKIENHILEAFTAALNPGPGRQAAALTAPLVQAFGEELRRRYGRGDAVDDEHPPSWTPGQGASSFFGGLNSSTLRGIEAEMRNQPVRIPELAEPLVEEKPPVQGPISTPRDKPDTDPGSLVMGGAERIRLLAPPSPDVLTAPPLEPAVAGTSTAPTPNSPTDRGPAQGSRPNPATDAIERVARSAVDRFRGFLSARRQTGRNAERILQARSQSDAREKPHEIAGDRVASDPRSRRLTQTASRPSPAAAASRPSVAASPSTTESPMSPRPNGDNPRIKDSSVAAATVPDTSAGATSLLPPAPPSLSQIANWIKTQGASIPSPLTFKTPALDGLDDLLSEGQGAIVTQATVPTLITAQEGQAGTSSLTMAASVPVSKQPVDPAVPQNLWVKSSPIML